ncbi:MAG: hypothetical protein J0G96_01735 [Flavobacteriia bacterium]|nr:hypothetical protein [Flavobacteriia bacterium]OJX39752.1 MAG: hypothetical protein BGO87_02005 [Flavobacteriia bacterium 40-80]
MKKVLFVAAVAVLGLSSCKKDWTCSCTGTSGSANVATYSNTTKKLATDACKTYETNAKTVFPNIACEVK